jgi:predicted transcriptional regulator
MHDQDKAQPPRGLLRMVADVVASYVRSTRLAASQLPEVIERVHGALQKPAPTPPALPKPAVPIRHSVTPEYLICLEDGKKLKMLKRYLMRIYGMSPAQYRSKWGLPTDYPMVAPTHSLRRRSIAKASLLGHRKERSAELTTAESSVAAAARERQVRPRPKRSHN